MTISTAHWLTTRRATSESPNVFTRAVGDKFDEITDPYCFSDRLWIDDIRKWLAVDFPAIYTHLIDTPGGYTRELSRVLKPIIISRGIMLHKASLGLLITPVALSR